TGGARINTMMGYRQQRPKIGLTVCPDLVDHYKPLVSRLSPAIGELQKVEAITGLGPIFSLSIPPTRRYIR
ncbi:hypothetical protein, partial [Aeromonas sp. R7-3]|uniref:hypothetical protein n=1 Tax=Aeromonas sp. R7-3 TaxID=3138475 RepID=UPI0034A4CCCE